MSEPIFEEDPRAQKIIAELDETIRQLRADCARKDAALREIAVGRTAADFDFGHGVAVDTMTAARLCEIARAALDPAAPEPSWVPQYGDPNHDMMRGPCKCGAWHDPAPDPPAAEREPER